MLRPPGSLFGPVRRSLGWETQISPTGFLKGGPPAPRMGKPGPRGQELHDQQPHPVKTFVRSFLAEAPGNAGNHCLARRRTGKPGVLQSMGSQRVGHG